MMTGAETFDKRTIARLIAKLKDTTVQEAEADAEHRMPLFGWDAYQNPTAILEQRHDRFLIARLLPVIDQRLPAEVDLMELEVRWKPTGDVRLDAERPPHIIEWLAETVYLSLLAAHLVKAAPSSASSQLTFRTPYLAWWRFGTLLVTQAHPILLGVSPEVVPGTSYAGLAWYAPERAWIKGRGLPGLWGHRVMRLANRAVEVGRAFKGSH